MLVSLRRICLLAPSLALSLTCAVSAAPPGDQVVLASGDVLRGSIVSYGDGVLVIDHPELGQISLPLDRVRSFGPIAPQTEPATGSAATPIAVAPDAGLALPNKSGPGASGQTVKAEAKLPAAPVVQSVQVRRLTGDWDVHLAFALAGNFAINDEFTMRAGIGATRESPRTKTTVDGEYYYRIFENETTDNNILAKVLQEWKLGETPWLFFAQGQYQYDEFEPWTHRISGYLGPGYRVIDTDAIGLTLRLGAGATYEAGEVHRWEPEVLLAEDFRWRITERQRVAFNVSIAPNVDDVADYRAQANIEYQLLIDQAKRGLSLTAGLRDIFLSKPAEDGEANELRVYAGLRYDF